MKFILTKKFCVYVDFIEKNDEFIAGYVGKGTYVRVNCKLRNKHHQQISINHEWKRVVGFETDDENEAFEVEMLLIRELHTYVHDPEKTRYACNYTLGGEGESGRIFRLTKEQRLKYSKIAKIAHNTPQAKAAHSKAAKGRIISELELQHKREAHAKPEIKAKYLGSANGRAKSVIQYTKENICIAYFETINDAAKMTKTNRNCIRYVCNGERPFAGGFIWRWAN